MQKRVLDPKVLTDNPTLELQLFAHELGHREGFKDAYLGPKVDMLNEMNAAESRGEDLNARFKQLIG